MSRCWWTALRTRRSFSRSSPGCKRRGCSSETLRQRAARSSARMGGRLDAALTLELVRTRAASSTPARRSPQCERKPSFTVNFRLFCLTIHFMYYPRYDSLAAELREKLGGRQPLLLPPRDYDTMHRSRGNVVGSEERKSLNPRVVGASAVGRDVESSGKSSGIGSEEGEMINGGDASPLGDQGFLPDQDDRSSSGEQRSSFIGGGTTQL